MFSNTNSPRHKFISISLPLIFLPFALGCANSNLDTIHDAQACLDKATSSTAMTCYSMVASDTTSSGSLIRCASILVYEGFGSATILQNAATQLNGSSAGNAAAALAFLADKGGNTWSSTTDASNAKNAATQCAASGSSGLSMLASLSSVATVASSLIGSGTPSLTNITGSTNATNIVTAAPQVPGLLVTTYQQNCSGTISTADQSFCTQYATAAAANPSNPTAAAIAFLTSLH